MQCLTEKTVTFSVKTFAVDMVEDRLVRGKRPKENLKEQKKIDLDLKNVKNMNDLLRKNNGQPTNTIEISVYRPQV